MLAKFVYSYRNRYYNFVPFNTQEKNSYSFITNSAKP